MRDKNEPWIEQSDYGKLAAGIWLAVEVGEAKVVLVCCLWWPYPIVNDIF